MFDASVVTFPANPTAIAALRADDTVPGDDTIALAGDGTHGMDIRLARAVRDRLTTV